MKWGEPIIMALKKCPKCGMDNILRQDSCQYCRFNMHSYVNNLLHETASMTPEERKQKIYAQILKPPAPKQSAEMYTNIWEFIKGNKKAAICLGLGFLYLGIGLLTSSWFLDILSILVIIGGIGLVNDALRSAKNTQNRYVLEQNEYSNIINNFNAYKEKMTQDILEEIERQMKKDEQKEQEKKIKKYYTQPIIECPACGKEISSEAEICVHCGYPLRKMLIKKGYRADEKKSPVIQPVSTNILKCPKCGSTSITTEEIGYGTFGWIGASQKKNLCQKCGYKWWPGTK